MLYVDNTDFQSVRKEKRATTKIPDKPHGQLVGAERIKERVDYVDGISLNCSADDLKSFCDCSVLDCRLMPSRRHGTLPAVQDTVVVVIADGFQIICGAVQAYSADVIDSLLYAFCPDQLSV